MGAVDYITAGVAIYGAALSSVLAYLTWSDRRSGAKVALSYGMLAFGAELSAQHMIITVSNPTSRPLTIEGIGLRLPNGKTIIAFGSGIEHRLPYRLDEGERITAWIAVGELQHHLRNEGYGSAAIRGFGRDATGRTFLSKRVTLSAAG